MREQLSTIKIGPILPGVSIAYGPNGLNSEIVIYIIDEENISNWHDEMPAPVCFFDGKWWRFNGRANNVRDSDESRFWALRPSTIMANVMISRIMELKGIERVRDMDHLHLRSFLSDLLIEIRKIQQINEIMSA